MNKLINSFKVLVVAMYLVILVALLGLQVWSKFIESGFSVVSFIYWMILFGWIGLIVNYKWSSSTSLVPALALFILGALLATIGFREIAETVMRISFIGWMVGITQALVEYKRNEKS